MLNNQMKVNFPVNLNINNNSNYINRPTTYFANLQTSPRKNLDNSYSLNYGMRHYYSAEIKSFYKNINHNYSKPIYILNPQYIANKIPINNGNQNLIYQMSNQIQTNNNRPTFNLNNNNINNMNIIPQQSNINNLNNIASQKTIKNINNNINIPLQNNNINNVNNQIFSQNIRYEAQLTQIPKVNINSFYYSTQTNNTITNVVSNQINNVVNNQINNEINKKLNNQLTIPQPMTKSANNLNSNIGEQIIYNEYLQPNNFKINEVSNINNNFNNTAIYNFEQSNSENNIIKIEQKRIFENIEIENGNFNNTMPSLKNNNDTIIGWENEIKSNINDKERKTYQQKANIHDFDILLNTEPMRQTQNKILQKKITII